MTTTSFIKEENGVYNFKEIYTAIQNGSRLNDDLVKFVVEAGPWCKLPFRYGYYRPNKWMTDQEEFLELTADDTSKRLHAGEFNIFLDDRDKNGNSVRIHEFDYRCWGGNSYRFRIKNNTLQYSWKYHSASWRAWSSTANYKETPATFYYRCINDFWNRLRRVCVKQARNTANGYSCEAAIKHTNAYMALAVAMKELEEETHNINAIIEEDKLIQEHLTKLQELMKRVSRTIQKEKKVLPLWR